MLANLYLHVEQGTYKFSFLFAQSPSGTAFDHENGKLTHTYPQCIISPSSHTRSTPNSYKPDHESIRLTNSQKNRGKGTPRRKVKKVHKSSGADDKKLQATLKKMNVQPIQAIEEVNMFKEDGNVIHFGAPKEKELTELVPGILNQLGPDSLASLRKLAESYQNMQKNQAGAEGKKDDDEDDIPDLVEGENFESNVE
ncbi:unnamed protein product [Aspergillus oryzae]|uniref:Nascent polypeptide-associated complex subunit beta n=1 Tax=Aspergillus oryzae TaxID=5062 RepID=A0AAN4YAS2_ASPOZ|nr:unnamed protein product [Aspergillus oryzae]